MSFAKQDIQGWEQSLFFDAAFAEYQTVFQKYKELLPSYAAAKMVCNTWGQSFLREIFWVNMKEIRAVGVGVAPRQNFDSYWHYSVGIAPHARGTGPLVIFDPIFINAFVGGQWDLGSNTCYRYTLADWLMTTGAAVARANGYDQKRDFAVYWERADYASGKPSISFPI